VLSWDIAIPIYGAFFAAAPPPAGMDPEVAAYGVWATQIRYLGVGAMLIGGIWTLFSLRSSLMSGVRSGLAATRAGAAKAIAETEKDIPMKAVLIGIVAFAVPLAVLYHAIVNDIIVSVPMTIIMIIAGFLFSSVSAYMAGLVGSSNNPVSGITIATILFASLVLIVLLGSQSQLGPVAAIMIGAVVCCAAAVAGDNLQDLKCGYLVGATPWRQQLMLAIGAVSCALVMAPVLNLLNETRGIGVPTAEHPNPLLAPQATLMATVSKGMFGGDLPWTMVWIGTAVGAVIIAIDLILKKRGATFRVPVLAAAVGIYLPLDVTMPILLGGMLTYFVERRAGVPADAKLQERMHQDGILYSSGLITGEALMGIVIAFFVWKWSSPDVLALPESFQSRPPFDEWLGLIVFIVLGYLLYRTGVTGARRVLGGG
ncbi:MAG: OPT family oligopeptide transporter, partial [Steroidobacteraceae bacterium]